MEKAEALKIIGALADGIDPTTGVVFPDSSPYQHPKIIRALLAAVRAMEQDDGEKLPRERALPNNAGKPWNPEEDKVLCERFDAGMTIRELAQKHDRTNGAIRARLEKKGKLVQNATLDQTQ